MMRIRVYRFAMLCVVAAAIGTGCSDTPTQPGSSSGGPGAGPSESLGPGIYASLTLGAETSGVRPLGVAVKRVGDGPEISSAQLVLEFDPAILGLRGGEVRRGLLGAWSEISPGRLRIAAAALDGLGDEPLLTLSVSPTKPLGKEHFIATYEELTSSDGFEDLLELVVPRPHPLFTAAGAQ